MKVRCGDGYVWGWRRREESLLRGEGLDVLRGGIELYFCREFFFGLGFCSELDFLLGLVGSRCLLSRVGVVMGGEWSESGFVGYVVIGREVWFVGFYWKDLDLDGWSWGVFVELFVFLNN